MVTDHITIAYIPIHGRKVHVEALGTELKNKYCVEFRVATASFCSNRNPPDLFAVGKEELAKAVADHIAKELAKDIVEQLLELPDAIRLKGKDS